MRLTLLALALVSVCTGAIAGGFSGGVRIQPDNLDGLYCNGTQPTIQITVPGESGQMGVMYVGLVSPDHNQAVNLTQDGTLQTFQGGLYTPAAVFWTGMPGSQVFEFSMGGGMVSPYGGWSLMTGSGAYTQESQAKVATLRAHLNQVKPLRIANGTWSSVFDSDTDYILAYVQKNMTDNNQYQNVATIGTLDCTPPRQGE